MKKSLLLTVSALSLMIASCTTSSNNAEKVSASDSVRPVTAATAQIFNLDTTSLKAGEKYYQCEMNLEILSDKPGSCPTCGMDLSEMKKQ